MTFNHHQWHVGQNRRLQISSVSALITFAISLSIVHLSASHHLNCCLLNENARKALH